MPTPNPDVIPWWGIDGPTLFDPSLGFSRGIRLARYKFDLKREQDSPGVHQSLIDSYYAAGVHIHPILFYSDYSGPATDFTNDVTPWVPPGLTQSGRSSVTIEQWGQLCSDFAARYGANGDGGPGFILYEIWNEPNVSSFWNGLTTTATSAPNRVDEYFPVIYEAHKRIRVAQSSSRFIAGSLASGTSTSHSLDWIQAFLQHADSPNLLAEAMGMHCYPTFISNSSSLLGSMNAVRDMMNAHAGDNLELWLTETGSTSGSKSGSCPPAVTSGETSQAAKMEHLRTEVLDVHKDDWKLGPMMWWPCVGTSNCPAGVWKGDADKTEKLSGPELAHNDQLYGDRAFPAQRFHPTAG